MAVPHTVVGGGPTGSTTTLDLAGTSLHLVRVTPNQMRILQRVGTHHVPFLQHPEWPNKSVLESHMRNAATQIGHPQPTDGEVLEAYDLFSSTHKQPLPLGPPRGNEAHQRPPEQVEYVPGATVPAVLVLAPGGLKTTLRPGRARGNLWMLPMPTARTFCPPPLSQDNLTGTSTTCLRCGPQGLAGPWPLLQLMALYHQILTAHATPEQHRWLHTHFERASEKDTAKLGGAPAPRQNADSGWGRGIPGTRQLPSRCWLNTTAPHRMPPPTRLNNAAPKSRTGRQSNGPHSGHRERTCSNMCTATSHKATKGTKTMYA